MNEQDARAAVRAAIGKVAPDVELDDVGGDARRCAVWRCRSCSAFSGTAS